MEKFDPLYSKLLSIYGTEAAMAKEFGVTRTLCWKEKVPEKIALLCHLSPDIDYTYQPEAYGRGRTNLNLNLAKPKQQLKKAS
ncbi:MAG: hypothetical protein ACRCSS_02150 [Shewanella sp.]|uniref:hypothetical protein n=1 Tax=Plesiomonas shigelloides TaxID=703 RepID=UPI000A114302|nr:hypothetical protein [Plesiomonas shigelloides]